MNVIQKYIQKKRFEKYLKLDREFGMLMDRTEIHAERLSNNIKKLGVERSLNITGITEEDLAKVIECHKPEMACEFAKLLIPYIKVESFDSEAHPFRKIVRGTIYVVSKEGK